MADVFAAETQARIRLTRNTNREILNLPFHPDPSTFTEFVSSKLTITATATQTLPLGTISTARRIWIKADKDITVKFDGNGTGASYTGTNVLCYMVGCEVTQIDVTNDDAVDDAQVQYVVTD
jgi:hypothetical protein